MRTPTWVLGYHGCEQEVAEAVLAGRLTLRVSENDYDWLGTGIYFWENSPERALEWARHGASNPVHGSKAIRSPAVIGAILDLGNCLDLLEAESIRLVRAAYSDMRDVFEDTGRPLPANAGPLPTRGARRLDCAVINFAHTLRDEEEQPPFDSVRAAFMEGEPLYPGAGFHEQTHLQVCIRSESQIIAYFRVRQR